MSEVGCNQDEPCSTTRKDTSQDDPEQPILQSNKLVEIDRRCVADFGNDCIKTSEVGPYCCVLQQVNGNVGKYQHVVERHLGGVAKL
jgi:hypothetical protein